jgi:hypothetical protein
MSQAFTDQLKQVVSEFETLGYNHTKKAAEQVRIVCELHHWSKKNLQTLQNDLVIWRAGCSQSAAPGPCAGQGQGPQEGLRIRRRRTAKKQPDESIVSGQRAADGGIGHEKTVSDVSDLSD